MLSRTALKRNNDFFKNQRLLPGFGLTLGFSLFYFCLIVLVPLSALFVRSLFVSWNDWLVFLRSERLWHSLYVTFSSSFIAAGINLVFGGVLAWVLVRYRFWGRTLIDALIDIPFALPTAIAGVSLTSLYMKDGLIGKFLTPLGIDVSFTRLGIIVALTFVGIPFVVRTVQPVLEDLEKENEEVALLLGANTWQRFIHVILPAVFPSLTAGFMMAFARGIGEYGSVIFIAGNVPFKTEITPLLIVVQLEEFNYDGATVIAFILLLFSFLLLFATNALGSYLKKKRGQDG